MVIIFYRIAAGQRFILRKGVHPIPRIVIGLLSDKKGGLDRVGWGGGQLI